MPRIIQRREELRGWAGGLFLGKVNGWKKGPRTWKSLRRNRWVEEGRGWA